MTEAPPALAQRPQFDPEYWRKIPRHTTTAHIMRVTNKDDGWVEIALKNGVAFQRRKADIAQLLTANMEVHIETINNELVTGMFVPGVGWAFRMSNEDLAEYTKDVAAKVYQRAQEQRQALIEYLTVAMVAALDEIARFVNVEFDEGSKAEAGKFLAVTALGALQRAGKQ